MGKKKEEENYVTLKINRKSISRVIKIMLALIFVMGLLFFGYKNRYKIKRIFNKPNTTSNGLLIGTPNKEDETKLQVKVNIQKINIRESTNSKSKKLGIVQKDSIFTVLDYKADNKYIWIHIKTNNNIDGYIATEIKNPYVLFLNGEIDIESPTLKLLVTTLTIKNIDDLSIDLIKEKIEATDNSGNVEIDYSIDYDNPVATNRYRMTITATDSSNNSTSKAMVLEISNNAKTTETKQTATPKKQETSKPKPQPVEENKVEPTPAPVEEPKVEEPKPIEPEPQPVEEKTNTIIINATKEYSCKDYETYKASSHTCTWESFSTEAKELICPKGYEAFSVLSKTCKRITPSQTIVEPTEKTTCSAGDQYYVILNGVEYCRKGNLTIKKLCPSGYTLSSVKVGAVTKYSCMWAYENSTTTGYIKCNDGYTFDDYNNICYKTQSRDADVKYTCPSNYTLNGDKCYSN